MKAIVTIETVPKKMLEAYKDITEPVGGVPIGLSLVPKKKRSGTQKIEVLIQEKMSQYKTRETYAHELFHVLQYLTNCEQDEQSAYDADKVMVLFLKEKKKHAKGN